MSYLTNNPYFSESEKVTLINGRYEWNHQSKEGPFLSYYLQYKGQYIYGDFNRDGLKDAAVIMAENNGGTAEWRSVAFLINDGTNLTHQTSGYLGDRAIINSIRQKNGKVFVDMFVHQDRDCMAGPTNHVIDVFEYVGGKRLVDGKRVSEKSIFDPIILMLKTPEFLMDIPSWTYVLDHWRG